MWYLSRAYQDHMISVLLNRADQSDIGLIHGGEAAAAPDAGVGGDRRLLVAASKRWFAKCACRTRTKMDYLFI
jgi:hypothetical protein